ncbi:MAG: hypothetical protein FJ146_08880 [Deltaproteobacteria bacterium]|nr:hypothetical protein [Deltaproteobacteria bacterium]
MLKTLQIGALLVLAQACGQATSQGAMLTGAPHEFDAICGIDADIMSFRIYEGKGLLQGASFPGKGFACRRGDYPDPSSQLAWICDEVGGGNAHVEIQRISSGAKQATVTLDGPSGGAVHKLNCY